MNPIAAPPPTPKCRDPKFKPLPDASLLVSRLAHFDAKVDYPFTGRANLSCAASNLFRGAVEVKPQGSLHHGRVPALRHGFGIKANRHSIGNR